jgi:LysM repeat protein
MTRAAGQVTKAAGVPLLLAAVLTAAAPGWGKHTIAPGETLEAIAARYDTTVTELIKANDLPGSGDLIHAGAILAVPQPAPAPQLAPPVLVSETIEHRVAPGENLTVVATAHGVDIQTLRAANDVGPRGMIRAGQILVVPIQRAVVAEQATEQATHRVGAGETVGALARRYGVGVAAIGRANSLDVASTIRVGQELKIPTRAPVPGSGGNTFAGRTYAPEVVAAADRNRAELAARSVPSREQVRAMIVATAQEHGVDPNLALAISYQESGFDHRRVSVANAVGAMQVLPGTAQWMSNVLGRQLDVLDAQDNITAGVVLLRVLGQAAESEDQAIGAYYQGLRSMRERGPAADTVQYIANVQALRGRFAGG